VCEELIHPAHFFVARPAALAWDGPSTEESFWELFHGRLLDGTQTRERRRFVAWNVHWVGADGERSTEPVVALKYDAAAGEVHVTRAILCHAHESYDAGGNVIQSREVVKWQRELVGTARLGDQQDAGAPRDELACLLFHAVVGHSRLPLTSVESPLPGFSLGLLGYFYRPSATDGTGPMTAVADLCRLPAETELASAERVKLLELILRATPAIDLPGLIPTMLQRFFGQAADGTAAVALLRSVFNAVTLSPYTDFAAKAIAFVRLLAEQRRIVPADRADFVAHLIRQLGRHLAAYDLTTFHHRGANYPDALLLGELWDELLANAEQQPELFADSNGAGPLMRRRAIRQGALLRAEYAGHAVPDAPTSPGENVRVLPEPFKRIPEEQIYSPITRRRRLFENDRLPPQAVFRFVVQDLDNSSELRELGTAIFLDRPLGCGKAPGEPDQTLLTSHVLFSRSLAERRLRHLSRWPEIVDPAAVERWLHAIRTMPLDGVALTAAGPAPRPGVVSLHDALRVADDFVVLRTTRQTFRDFQQQYDLSELASRLGEHVPPVDEWRCLLPAGTGGETVLRVYDQHFRSRLELAADLSQGYGTRGSIEFPIAGLRVRRAWSLSGAGVATPIDFGTHSVVIPPRR
jgi:hypothetical protein